MITARQRCSESNRSHSRGEAVLPRSRRYRYKWLVAALVLGCFAVPAASASASRPRCASGQDLGACTAGLAAGMLGANECQSNSTAPGAPPQAQTSAGRLEGLIEDVPCPKTGRVSYNTSDNLGDPMAVLDTVPDPEGGYLGVYHTAFGSRAGAKTWAFRTSLAHSADLIHWTRIAVLDPIGATMPTVRPIPRAPGYVLAYEKRLSRGGNVVRVRYYRTLGDLLAGRFANQRDLPREFSPYNNGTPTIVSIRWNGAITRSVIALGFHYQTAPRARPGPDREAIGTLSGFRRWSPHPDSSTDAELDRAGLRGSHGDWRGFSFEGGSWRVYEAQTSYNDFGTWRVLLDSSGQMRPLTLSTTSGAVSSSIGNPVAEVEPAPDGHGQVLVITMFLFGPYAPGEGGELVYYQPI
jgi:hypothetical protein